MMASVKVKTEATRVTGISDTAYKVEIVEEITEWLQNEMHGIWRLSMVFETIPDIAGRTQGMPLNYHVCAVFIFTDDRDAVAFTLRFIDLIEQ